jgi:hypothetical protein
MLAGMIRKVIVATIMRGTPGCELGMKPFVTEGRRVNNSQKGEGSSRTCLIVSKVIKGQEVVILDR